MDPKAWLEKNVFGFNELPEEDRQAILYFSLLWSLFEASALQTHASSSSILVLARRNYEQGQLNLELFEPSLNYFRHRYFVDGAFTENFDGLHLRDNDNLQLVRQVIQGGNENPGDVVAALLIIIYRLRNNLFHGVKWAYGIQGQLRNFEFANRALMIAITQFGEK